MGIGERLKEERIRLGLSQTEFAARGGASKRSQIDWEAEKAAPNATFLAALAADGLDVSYVVTGVRAIAASDALPPRAKALLDNYQASDPEGQRAIERMALVEAQRQAPVGVSPTKKRAA